MENPLTMTPISLVFILFMGVLTLLLPRRFGIIPLIVTTCYMPLGQGLQILNANFPLFRIIIFFGCVRLIIRGELNTLKLNIIDKTIIWWVVISIITGTILGATFSALISTFGLAYNALGAYFIFRCLIRDINDIRLSLKAIAIIIIPLAIAMLIEHISGKNFFSIFGGIPEYTIMEGGRLRCRGPFGHPILAGTFGAVFIPLFVGLWWENKRTWFISLFGIIGATIILLTSMSTGPLSSAIFGIMALLMWPLRGHMKTIKWVMFYSLIALHMFMKSPVWHLMGRLSNITGGDGWTRSYLIDAAISHFGEWWLVGTNYTDDWAIFGTSHISNMTDITNQYIFEAVNGGLLKMLLFIMIIVVCFREIGKFIKSFENSPSTEKIIIWSMGASLFVNVMSFMSVSYFDQIIIIWYLLLAFISIGTTYEKEKNDNRKVLT
jgi:hypothetical protein